VANGVANFPRYLLKGKMPKCVNCLSAKSKRQPANKRPPILSVDDILQHIHFDLLGTHSRTRNGFCYYLLIIDAFSRFIHIDILKTKDQATDCIKCFILTVQQRTDKKVQTVQSDGGGKFKNASL